MKKLSMIHNPFTTRDGDSLKRPARIYWYDWAAAAILLFSCYLLFAHGDIRVSAENSLNYLDGHLLDFYSACYEKSGAYSANYLPSTFIGFAVWNIPLKLLGLAPAGWKASTLLNLYWYKLLPVAVYCISGYLVYLIAHQDLKMSREKARVAAYVFLTAPLAVFSQFMFCQYDIFTVVFMLLGLYYYLKEQPTKKDHFFFILYFGLSATFKYYSILIFAVLLLLRTKKVWKILLALAGVAGPYVIEFLLYYFLDRESFVSSIFGFFALDFVKNGEISIGMSALRLFPFVMCLLLAWSFFILPGDRSEQISYALFFCNGVTFALFSLMSWHPQWLLFGVAFWSLSSCISKRFDIFILLDSAYILFFYVFIATQFKNNVDQSLLQNGIFRDQLSGRILTDAKSMSEIYQLDATNKNLLFTVLAAILLVNFIFKHPKFCNTDFNTPLQSMWTIRVRLLAGVVLFAVPALLCLPSMLAQPKVVWENQVNAGNALVEDLTGDPAIQYITPTSDTIGLIEVRTATYDQELKEAKLVVSILEPGQEEPLSRVAVEGSKVANNSVTEIVFPTPVKVEPGKRYAVSFALQTPDIQEENIALYYYKPLTAAKWNDEDEKAKFDTDYLEIYGKAKRTGLDMRVLSGEFPKVQEAVGEESSSQPKQNTLTDRQIEKEWEENWIVSAQASSSDSPVVSPFG